jgi:hypothetical protein
LHAIPLIVERANRNWITNCVTGLFYEIQTTLVIDYHDVTLRVLFSYRRIFWLRNWFAATEPAVWSGQAARNAEKAVGSIGTMAALKEILSPRRFVYKEDQSSNGKEPSHGYSHPSLTACRDYGIGDEQGNKGCPRSLTRLRASATTKPVVCSATASCRDVYECQQ